MPPNSPPSLTILVISYNTREMTLDCLRSVYRETKTPFELIVVDNASSDGSVEAIRDEFPGVTLIAEATNHGFGPAHEIGLAHASAPWLLLLNPDTIVLDAAIDKLMGFAERTPKAGIWGGRTLFADGTLNKGCCWSRMTLFSTFTRVAGLAAMFPNSALLNSEAYGSWQRDTERSVDIIAGCFLLIRRADWDALGGFDPAFTMYGEETDLCLRALAAGFRPRLTPDAEIIHYAGASETVVADKMVRLMRAKIELIRRHFHPATRGIGRAVFGIWPLSRAVAFGVAGTLSGKPAWREKAATWGEIWRRRSEWKGGYSGSK